MTQDALAELFETTKRTIRRWETGEQPIPGAAKVAMRLMQPPSGPPSAP
ncbi:helix-turn-helix domain-containing protein [Acidiphilium sp.]